jgi:two-component system sensor histidine kinase KdpD
LPPSSRSSPWDLRCGPVTRGADTGYLAAFLVTAATVAVIVEQAEGRRAEVLRGRHEADAGRALTKRLVQPNPPQAVLAEIHRALDRESVAVLAPDGEGWTVEDQVGDGAPIGPEDGESFPLRDGHVLVMTARVLRPDGHRFVAALVSYLEAVRASHRLRSQAAVAEGLAEGNDLRTALLEAVSHDLRTPLASIRALTTGWLAPDVDLSDDDTHDSIAAIDQEAQRLTTMVDNLLDMGCKPGPCG